MPSVAIALLRLMHKHEDKDKRAMECRTPIMARRLEYRKHEGGIGKDVGKADGTGLDWFGCVMSVFAKMGACSKRTKRK